jgi:digeranylgeranylglycerophospholipid reductase
MPDIAVIGGGPVGSWTAFRLAKMGHRVTVLEKRPGIGEKHCCTGIISQECAAKYDISPHLIFRQVNSARIISPSGLSLGVKRPETQACIVNRQAFDRALAVKAQSQGVEYLLNTGAEDISFKPNGIQIKVEVQGKVGYLSAQAAVLATGFNAPLIKRLGFGQPDYLVAGVQAEVGIKSLPEVEVYFDQELAPGFFAWLVPTTGERALAGLLTNQSPGQHLQEWLAQLAAQGKIISAKAQIRHGGIPLKPLTKTFSQRLLIVGDAAGHAKPTTGGGIYFGLLGADIAADTLHQAFTSGDLSARYLSQYEQNWRQKLGPELRIEIMVRRLYEHLSNSQIEKLLSVLKSTGIVDSLLKEETLSFDWHGGLMLKLLKLRALSKIGRLLKPS